MTSASYSFARSTRTRSTTAGTRHERSSDWKQVFTGGVHGDGCYRTPARVAPGEGLQRGRVRGAAAARAQPEEGYPRVRAPRAAHALDRGLRDSKRSGTNRAVARRDGRVHARAEGPHESGSREAPGRQVARIRILRREARPLNQSDQGAARSPGHPRRLAIGLRGRASVSPPRVRFFSGTEAQAHRSGRRSYSRCPLPAARCPLPAARCPLPAATISLASHPFACRYATVRTYISR